MPSPCSAPDQTTDAMDSCIEKCDIIHSEIAVSTKPAPMIKANVIDASDQLADEQHGNQGAGTARRSNHARLQYRIAHQPLQQRWQQRQRCKQHDSNQEYQDIAGEEIAVLVQRQPDEGLLGSQRVRDEQIKRQRTDRRLDLDLTGIEPGPWLRPRSSSTCNVPTAVLSTAKPKKSKPLRWCVVSGK